MLRLLAAMFHRAVRTPKGAWRTRVAWATMRAPMRAAWRADVQSWRALRRDAAAKHRAAAKAGHAQREREQHEARRHTSWHSTHPAPEVFFKSVRS